MTQQFVGAAVAGVTGQGSNDLMGDDNGAQAAIQKAATDAMTNYAVGRVRNVYEENKGWISFLSFDALKVYFDVTNTYVLHKLKIILLPFLVKEEEWRQGGSMHATVSDYDDDIDGAGVSSGNTPKNNLQAPDLYIPLMSFVTYLLLTGFYHG